MDGLCIILQKDLIAGEDLFFCENAVLCKELDALIRNEVGHGVRERLKIRETAAVCLLDPLVSITVSVKENPLVLRQQILEQGVDGSIQICGRNIFEPVINLCQDFSYSSVEYDVGVCH